MFDRRELTVTLGLGLGLTGAGFAAPAGETADMNAYGLTGSILAHPGQRDALKAILLESATRIMPGVDGCRAYVVGVRDDDQDAVWITEIWDSAEQHMASLQVPEIQQVIARARPLIAGMGAQRIELRLEGGHGLG